MEQNLRQSYRAPVENGHQTARLFTRRDEVMAFLVNESAGGFGIMTELSVALSEGETVWLQTAGGCSEARVVNSKMEVGAKRFGLQRLRDLPEDWHEHLARDLWPDVRVQKRLRPWLFIRRRIAIGAGVVLVLLAGVIAFMWDDLSSQVDAGTLLGSWNKVLTGESTTSSKSRSTSTAPVQTVSTNNSFLPPPSLPSLPGGRELSRIRAPSKNLGKVIFSLPQAARDVKLDQKQQVAIRGIVEEALGAVDTWAATKPQDQDRMLSILFDDAAKRVMAVLTPEQKAHWKSRMDQPVSKEQAAGFMKSLTTIEEILDRRTGGKGKNKHSSDLAKMLDEARLRTWVSLSTEQREQWRTLLGKAFSQ